MVAPAAMELTISLQANLISHDVKALQPIENAITLPFYSIIGFVLLYSDERSPYP